MKIAKRRNTLSIFLLVSSLFAIVSTAIPCSQVSATVLPLQWQIVDTPNDVNRVILSPSEVNKIWINTEGADFFAVDIPHGKLYQSKDGGITWENELSTRLIQAGANMPVWDICVAPDDSHLIVAITDGDGTPNGPKEVFISEDNGNTWDNVNIPVLPANEYISCIDISTTYSGNKRDIAVGTRNGTGNSAVWVFKTTNYGGGSWSNQSIAPSTGWTNGDVIALKFSPNYVGDESIVTVSVNAGGTFLNLGNHDGVNNSTAWNTIVNYPVQIISNSGNSPDHTEIITADLELPANFGESQTETRHYFISTDAYNGITYTGGVFRVDGAVNNDITPPTTERISSISYFYNLTGENILLAGSIEVEPTIGKAEIWRCTSPDATYPTWPTPERYKAPTGGANSGFANAQVKFGADGDIAYCGTSSADFQFGGTSIIAGSNCWPEALLNSSTLDESAFSVSPYSRPYEILRKNTKKTTDKLVGNVWNQISLIDTEITQFSDVAVLQPPGDPALVTTDYNILYLASLNTNANGFDSVWRSCGSSLGNTWERVLCIDTSDNGSILRVNINDYIGSHGVRSNAIAFADRFTSTVQFSDDEGQLWKTVNSGAQVTDLTLSSDISMFILDDTVVHRGHIVNGNWTWPSELVQNTHLSDGHTISTPRRNRLSEYPDKVYEDWVIVGDASLGEVAYVDYSLPKIKFEVIPSNKYRVPLYGNTHVIFDEAFYQNNTIYSALRSPSGMSGKIYRWTIGESKEWSDLGPINSTFYGLAQQNGVLYGAWNIANPPNFPPGVDRTLTPRAPTSSPIEWDDLITGLPVPGDANYPVSFTREPVSLKASSDGIENNLWALDDNAYDWNNKIGCLWTYNDPAIKIGPWSLAPYSGEYIPVDPVTGRNDEINFKWRQLIYAHRYQLQISKDESFSMQVMDFDNFTTVDLLSPALILLPGNLDANHKYYWRVRARSAMSGEIVRSPWSATMHFMIQAGLPIVQDSLGPQLLAPENNCGCNCNAPVCFSWSPFKETITYKFELSENASMTDPIVSTMVNTTAYQYDTTLKCGTNYFWRVQALEPWESDWSAIYSFQTEGKKSTRKPNSPIIQHTSVWTWVSIAVYIVLILAIIRFFRKSRSLRKF